MTGYLSKTGFWGSFNVPYFKNIRNNLGYTEVVKKYQLKATEYDFFLNSRYLYL